MCLIGWRRENKSFIWKIDPKQTICAYFCSCQSSIRDQWPKIIMSIKQYGRKHKEKRTQHICCFFMLSNLINVRKYKYGRIVPSVHQFILLSANPHCHFHITFMYISLYFQTSFSTLYFSCFPFFSINHNQKQVR